RRDPPECRDKVPSRSATSLRPTTDARCALPAPSDALRVSSRASCRRFLPPLPLTWRSLLRRPFRVRPRGSVPSPPLPWRRNLEDPAPPPQLLRASPPLRRAARRRHTSSKLLFPDTHEFS